MSERIGALRLVVAVPTFRRPERLAQLIPQVLEQFDEVASRASGRMLVVDNDPRGSGRSAVPDLDSVSYVIEQTPGIAAARNRALDESVAELVARASNPPYFRPYTNTDVVGTEISGAVKNVIALAVGMAEGLGMGDNSKASIITRGLAETTRLGLALGADAMTFAGLAGVGDLIATCMSPLSRNHTFGVNLGKGMSVAEVVAVTRQTAEGVKSCESILQLAHEHDVRVPIIEQVAAVVHDGRSPKDVVGALMQRELKNETD